MKKLRDFKVGDRIRINGHFRGEVTAIGRDVALVFSARSEKELAISLNADCMDDDDFLPPFNNALVEACEMVCLGTEHTDEFTYLVDEFSEDDGSLFDAFLGLHIDRFGADPGYLPVVQTLAEIRKRSADVE